MVERILWWRCFYGGDVFCKSYIVQAGSAHKTRDERSEVADLASRLSFLHHQIQFSPLACDSSVFPSDTVIVKPFGVPGCQGIRVMGGMTTDLPSDDMNLRGTSLIGRKAVLVHYACYCM